jgi:hypothetical protein
MQQTEIIKQIIYLIYTLIFIGIWYFDYKNTQKKLKAIISNQKDTTYLLNKIQMNNHFNDMQKYKQPPQF